MYMKSEYVGLPHPRFVLTVGIEELSLQLPVTKVTETAVKVRRKVPLPAILLERLVSAAGSLGRRMLLAAEMGTQPTMGRELDVGVLPKQGHQMYHFCINS